MECGGDTSAVPRSPVARVKAHAKAEASERYEHVFEKAAIIRAAIDRAHVKHEAAIAAARKIAFFPLMTGG